MKNDDMGGHVARMGEIRNVYQISVGKPEGKRLLGRSSCGWKGNIRMYLKEIGWEGVGLAASGSGQGPVLDWLL
jgi:hypothetical protein